MISESYIFVFLKLWIYFYFFDQSEKGDDMNLDLTDLT